MKFKNRSCFSAVLALLLLVNLTLPITPAWADSQGSPMYVTNALVAFPITNGVTSSAFSNVTSGTFSNLVISVNPGYGASISMQWTNASSSSTSNAGVFLNFSTDGTNFPTATIPFGAGFPSNSLVYLQFAHNAGAPKWVAQNVSAATLDGYSAFRIEGITNCDSGNTISNIQIEIARRRLDYNQLPP